MTSILQEYHISYCKNIPKWVIGNLYIYNIYKQTMTSNNGNDFGVKNKKINNLSTLDMNGFWKLQDICNFNA